MSQELEISSCAVTPSGDPIMAAKFDVPKLPPWVVARQRLLDCLSRGVRDQLTLVSAPAGCGKTMMATSWATTEAAPGPVAWLSLDDDDDRPGVFWSYILAALARAGVPVSGVGMPTVNEAVDHSLLIRLAAALSEQSQPVILILDNAQVLSDRGVLDGVDFLLRHAGEHLRLVILTRVDPALPLHRYRLAGSMTEVRLDELAFTPVEARAVLAAHDADLPEGAAIAVAARARGWAASLRLEALSLQHRSETGGHPAGGHSEISAYFLAEFLNVQPPGIREFLLRTSVVDRMWPDLAVSLTGRRSAGHTLARLADVNAFVTSSTEDDRAYEYHPLIRELLQAQLQEEAPRKIGRLHRTAAHWLADAGLLTDATRHAAAAGDWEYAAWLLIEDLGIGRLLSGPDGAAHVELFAGMPSGTAGPEAAVIQSASALAGFDSDACAKHLLRARELVGEGPTDHSWALQLAIAATEAVSARVRGDVDDALTAVHVAEGLLSDASACGIGLPAALRTLIPLTKGSVLLAAGELTGASMAFAEGVRASDGPDSAYLQVCCLGQLALVEVHRGRLRKATEFAKRAHATADRHGLAIQDRPPAADVALAWVHAEEYDIAAARMHCERAAATDGIRHDPVSAGSIALIRARLHRARGDFAGAVAVLDRAQTPPTIAPTPAWLLNRLAVSAAVWRAASGTPTVGPASKPVVEGPHAPQISLALASIDFAGGDVTGAAATAAEVLRQARLPVDAQVEGWLLTAACELAEGRTAKAREALDHSLRLAAAEKLRRPVVEAPTRLRRFLRRDRDLAERNAWLGAPVVGIETSVTPTAGTPSARPESPVVELLTDKEMEVLRHLAALYSTEEIAHTMFVSVNTVKTHVRGILRKLAASRRNEAIRRAREMGWI
jgi:LuxR family transcriptional regulator, maltose regulon positive regulatory protein